jgi:GT2 family glycosyltransferase
VPPASHQVLAKRVICIFGRHRIRPTKQCQFERMSTDATGEIPSHDDSRDPLVSVVIPCFNAARTLSRTLASVCNQTYQHLDIIVVDDGSTDLSAAVAANFAASDRRVRLLKQPNAGVAAARNLGIASALGEFVAPVDADDLWAPEKIELQVRKIREDAAIGLVYAWFENINDDDEIFHGGFRFRFEGHVLHELCRLDFIGNGSNAMMRTSAARAVGGYDASLRAQGAEGCEDWKLALQLAEEHKFAVVPQILMGYRHSTGNMSNRTWQMIRSAKLVASDFSARHPDLAETLDQHIIDRLFSNCARCLKQRRWRDASRLMVELYAYGLKANFVRIISELKCSAGRLWRRIGRYLSQHKGTAGLGYRRKFP